jgi:hypothetical protein
MNVHNNNESYTKIHKILGFAEFDFVDYQAFQCKYFPK